jgi:hypothetical protein
MTLVTNEITMHKYYIGDLCYVIEDDVWSEVCDLSFDPMNDPGDMLQLQDGRQFFILDTAYGDGCYGGTDGKAYCVDSGTIGAISVECLEGSEKLKDAVERGLGHIVEFAYPLGEGDVSNESGTLYFGSLGIYTAGCEDDDDELDVEAEDEYDDELENQ